jgi:Rrf2 family iron-sulfur cluster assembly transcriptional regulator
MKLTAKGSYALQSLLDLIENSKGNPIRLQDIAHRQGLSILYLEKLFKQMRTKGVVQSARGPGGGYMLANPPDKVTVKDILLSVNEELGYDVVNAPSKENNTLCLFFQELEDKNKKVLETTLTNLLERKWKI